MLENVKDELINELDSQQLSQLMTAVNNWNGYFEDQIGDQIWIDMDCFDDYLSELTPSEIASRVAYGNFDPRHDDYFRFDIYGNLESAAEWDVEREILDLADEIIEQALENWNDIKSNLDDDLVELVENAMEEGTND